MPKIIPKKKQKVLRLLILVTFLSLLFLASFEAAVYIQKDEFIIGTIAKYGHLGALLIGVFSGLNFLLPFPPATLVPIFITAGISIPALVIFFTIGTTLADLIGYLFGYYTADYAKEKYPQTLERMQKFKDRYHKNWTFVFVFIYAAFIPLPNEAFIIPLAFLGVRLRSFLIPMILGTMIYHTVGVYGFNILFQTLI